MPFKSLLNAFYVICVNVALLLLINVLLRNSIGNECPMFTLTNEYLI